MKIKEFKEKLDIALEKGEITQEKYDHLIEWIDIIED